MLSPSGGAAKWTPEQDSTAYDQTSLEQILADFESELVAAHWIFPGISTEFGKFIYVSHWLITSLFAAFNIALHFIYRKRPEGQPCEV